LEIFLDQQRACRKRDRQCRHNRWPVGRVACFIVYGASAEPDERRRRHHRQIDEEHDSQIHHVGPGHVDQAPEPGSGEGGASQKSPIAQAGDRHGRGQHDRQIAEQRPGIRRFGGDEHRCHQRTEQADAGQRLAVQQRGGNRPHAEDPHQRECERRADEAVDAMRGVNRAEQGEGAGRGQHAGDIGVVAAVQRNPEAGAADELACPDKRNAEQRCHCEAQAGTENARLDRIADQEHPAERQRYATHPYGPACPERGFDIGPCSGLMSGRRKRGFGACRVPPLAHRPRSGRRVRGFLGDFRSCGGRYRFVGPLGRGWRGGLLLRRHGRSRGGRRHGEHE
jgi:hypothetical protein